MRRKDKEINDIADIENIINRASVCRLGLCENEHPYIVPLCFGYKDNTLYFHSAPEGRKLDILKKNNNVCFEFDIDHDLAKAEKACDWGMKYQSVTGFGKAVVIDDTEAKRKALDVIMGNYSNRSFTYPTETIRNTAIIKVQIQSMTGKKSGY